ncbi:hypothetical protein GCM10009795_003090 [Nocardioides hankookensis]|uniref:DUF3592 domain-containing protein n=1 Tax=Nocardioides hankookensis TaxID=443157 RepID=A0ABW1LL01_9ACTN
MTLEAIAAPVRTTPPQPLRHLAFCGIAWALLLCSAALLATGLLAGERASTYDELQHAVASGDVRSVVVTGGISESFRGRQGVTVHWREGAIGHQATVIEQHPLRWTVTPAGLPVVYSVERDLAWLDPDISVERRPHDFPDYYEVHGWRLPQWTSVVTVVLGLGGLLLLIAGPQPRRATRWAWFWMMSTAPPLGFVAFLTLGGALSPRPRPDLGRRLTGGRAFLLSIVVGAALSAMATAFL